MLYSWAVQQAMAYRSRIAEIILNGSNGIWMMFVIVARQQLVLLHDHVKVG